MRERERERHGCEIELERLERQVIKRDKILRERKKGGNSFCINKYKIL